MKRTTDEYCSGYQDRVRGQREETEMKEKNDELLTYQSTERCCSEMTQKHAQVYQTLNNTPDPRIERRDLG